ncbi:MAG: hypothetical protein QW612_03915 [Candidatus Bathyarchaeia archaeon]
MKVTQDIIAMICLRDEDEIPVDPLISDLGRVIAYSISPEEIYRSLQYLRRTSLISID